MTSVDWKNPDYCAIYTDRAVRLEALRESKENLAAAVVYYRSHIADFISDWGMTFDPRNPEIGQPALIPFVLFPRQRDYVEWILDHWRQRKSGVVEKSRDVGMSWLSVAIAAALFIFYPGIVIGFGSRKEEYVDKLDEPKSLFWKLRRFIELLPQEFRPVDWEAPYMRVVNRDNGSYVVGEAGTNIGRGARASIYFLDEAAYIEQQANVDAALSMTSNCLIWGSTANGAGNLFYGKRHDGKHDVFTFHWRQDPRKDAAWAAMMKDRLDPVIYAQEVEIDYNASTTDGFFDGEAVAAAQKLGVGDIEAIGPLILGIDAAHMGRDESVITPRRGRVCYDQEIHRKLDGPELAERVHAWVLRSPVPVAAIIIELDGPGISCYDALRLKPSLRPFVVGVHTGAGCADGRNYNVRARAHRLAREWLKQGGCRLPNDRELAAQMGVIRYGYKDGLLLLPPKKDLVGKGIKSPDRSDSFVLTFAADPPEWDSIRTPKVLLGRPGAFRR